MLDSALNNTHALIVGIANYRQINRLSPTVLKDARDIYEVLIDPQHGAYPRERVRLLLDGDATQAGLRQALSDLAARSDSDSTVLIYISSHGGRSADDHTSREYLLPVDADLSSEEALERTAICSDEFTTALSRVPARKVVVIFDCCHAGGIGQPKDALAPALKAGLPESYYDALQAGRGRVIFASSRDTEFSYIMPGAANSLFTEQLLSGLRGGVASDDGLVRIFDLFEYLHPRVTAAQPQQHPLFISKIEDNFPVALYLGGKKGIVPKDAQGFRYDAYISFADKWPDAGWVWDSLVPRLEAAGLRVAVSGDVEEPGVARVVNVERGVRQSKRTVILLSPNYLADNLADFTNVLAQKMGIEEGTYRLLPVLIAPIPEGALPTRLSMLEMLDLTQPSRRERTITRLLEALKGPLPHR